MFRWRGARARAKLAPRLDKERTSRLVEAGLWLSAVGDLDGARALFTQALSWDPTSERLKGLLRQVGAVARPPVERPHLLDRRPGDVGEPIAPRFALEVVRGPLMAGQRLHLSRDIVLVGSGRCGLSLMDSEGEIAPHHATLVTSMDGLLLRDEGSEGGTFASVGSSERLTGGALIRAGAHDFLYEGPIGGSSELFGLHELDASGRTTRSLTMRPPSFTVGRFRCDYALPLDETLAQQHFELALDTWGTCITDLAGEAGTFLRLPPREPRVLSPGDRFCVGPYVLRVESLA